MMANLCGERVAGDEFWSWLSANSERLFQMMKGDSVAVITEMGGEMQKTAPGVQCEGMHGNDDPYASLIISADGHVDKLELVKSIVKSAPDLPRWKVIAFRQRGLIADIGISVHGVSVKADDVFFRAFTGGNGELGVKLFVRGVEDIEDPRGHAAILLMDHAIGELDSMTTIQSLQFGLMEEPEDQYRNLTDLAGFLDEVKDVGIDRWESYMTRFSEDGPLASIFVKVGVAARGPQERRPKRLRILVPFVKPREDGLIDDKDEVELLWEIEEELQQGLKDSCEALFVGRVTTGGQRDFVFYAREGELLDVHVQKFFAHYPQYDPEILVHDDGEWSFFYEILMPDEYDSICISVHKRVYDLDQSGEDLTVLRTVEISCSFVDVKTRDHFLSELENSVTSEISNNPEDDSGRPFVVLVQKEHDAEFRSLNDFVLGIFKTIQAHSGQFDSWNCPETPAK
jgi:hypothetical protein